ncbi:acetyl-CoA carboxylase biotin carboxyl carrier protein subunit [Lacticaseibacillus paracasei]|uniref:acetyl-CoA carboxylase biotin carboxyl carrier protein subunit n=1 Tax=Lacticaseibacillus paracasei TaxID=1597 RepID=UPI0021C3C801|nr:acetyl-CoA carboxylase biotin carboxyl carrier protein subunit [Lacticaseibacillus paracasei]MCP9304811.1 acetyl-CoA carboxylase biotin carboxyl carrier protein subunit [Lacticaseibacillus paracasei]
MLRKFKITIDGKTYLVEMEEIGGAPAPAAPVAPTGEGEVVTAPMPGTVTKILVKDGDAVTENQPLMILEAMKMENEIVAPKAGTIGQVFATLNQNVNSGDNLISII